MIHTPNVWDEKSEKIIIIVLVKIWLLKLNIYVKYPTKKKAINFAKI